MKIMSILIVGEKPSVSRAISSVVGADKVQKGYTEGNGYIVSLGRTEISEWLRQRLGTEVELFAATDDSRKVAV